ncbi:hypothetical protein, partial [Morganella morganii]|uniref:hypothetical protein n=1 Tax=Morganella morganii TaxID=582 RepID=UPI00195312A9
ISRSSIALAMGSGTQGFTVMLFSFLPFCLAGINKSKNWKLSCLIVWVLGLYSILGHKEFLE